MSQHPELPSRDLKPRKASELARDYASVFEALDAMACDLEKRAIEAVEWYLGHKKWPKRFSQGFRAIAILLGVLGGLVPLVSGDAVIAQWFPKADHWGYVLIALAGAFVLFDRYFGFSSSWMRYMTAQMALQRAHENFSLAWAVWRIQVKDKAPSTEQFTAAIALLTAFQQQIGDLVDKEFQTWIAQFQEQLAALQAAIDKGRTEQRPGNLVVTYTAQTAIIGQAEVYLDNQMVRQTDSGSVILTGLHPGSHLVMVKANGGSLWGSATVKVEAGQVSEANIELKAAGPAIGS